MFDTNKYIPLELREAFEGLDSRKMEIATDLAHGVPFAEMQYRMPEVVETKIALANLLGMVTYKNVEKLNKKERSVFDILECQPHLTQTEISKKLKISQRIISYRKQAIIRKMPNWTPPLDDPYQEREPNSSESWREQAFVNKATEFNFGEYTYENCGYKGGNSPVWITCRKHGRVKVRTATSHIRPSSPSRLKDGRVTPGTGMAISRCPHCAYKPCGGTMVYLIEVASGEEKFLKVGITNYTIKTRYRPHDYPGISIKKLGEIRFSDRRKAREVEKDILTQLSDYKYVPKSTDFHPTECLSEYARNELESIFDMN